MFVRDEINNPRICTLRNSDNLRERTEDIIRVLTAIVILVLHAAKGNSMYCDALDALDARVCGIRLLDVSLFHRFGFELSRC